MSRLLVIARDFNDAKHWAREQRISPGYWVYVSSFYNIQGNPECEYVKIPGWETRPDVNAINENLEIHHCLERK